MHLLYSFRRCPYAMRARSALHASGTTFSLHEVDLRNKPQELLALSPKGTVPVLRTADGRVIEESLDIMMWALERNDPDGWLAADRDETLRLIARNDGEFKHHLDRYKYSPRYPGADPLKHRAAAAFIVTDLEHKLEGGALIGSTLSLADFAIYPFVRQFARTDPSWFAAQPWARISQWLVSVEAAARF